MLMGPPVTGINGWTSEQMKTQNLADALNAGRSTAVWYFDASKNDGYPTLDFEQALATSNNALRSKVQVYPTVFTDFMTINSKEKNMTYKVMDFSGRMIKSGAVNDGKVNFSQLGKGNYILVLQNGSELSSHKFIKK